MALTRMEGSASRCLPDAGRARCLSWGGGRRQDCRLNGPDSYANPHSEPSQYERGTDAEKSANFVLEIFLSNGIDSPVAK